MEATSENNRYVRKEAGNMFQKFNKRDNEEKRDTKNNNNSQMSDPAVILQWNCQGLRAKKDKLCEIINHHKPCGIALQ